MTMMWRMTQPLIMTLNVYSIEFSTADDELADEEEVLSLFIINEILDLIVKYTNEKNVLKSSKFTTKQSEIKDLLGLLLMAGILKTSRLSAKKFSSSIVPSIFRCPMSQN